MSQFVKGTDTHQTHLEFIKSQTPAQAMMNARMLSNKRTKENRNVSDWMTDATPSLSSV
jgi:hypothetical protein